MVLHQVMSEDLNRMSKPLWRIQREAIDYCLKNPNAMLNMDMGTGKTRVAIEVIMKLNCHNILVIAPKSVVPVWKTEVDKYAKDKYDVLLLGNGTLKSRCKRFDDFMKNGDKRKVVVINYDVVWRSEIYSRVSCLSWDIVILDESHRAKSHISKTSKACFRIGKSAERRLCLSGTPMANSPLDIFGQYRFLDQSIFGTRWGDFKEKYAVLGGPERRFIVGFKNLEELGERFNSIAFTATKADISKEAELVDEPEIVVRFGEMPKTTRKIYEDLRRDFISDWKGGIITASNVLVRLLRFQQLTSGFTCVSDIDEKESEYTMLDNVKINLLSELLEDLPISEPVVVFYKFRNDLMNIRSIKTERRVYELSGNRNESEKWKKDLNGILAVQYQAGSEGVDLTYSNYLVYYSLTHSLMQYDQSMARVHRPNQKKVVTVMHLIIENSIDEEMLLSLRNKRNIIQDVMENGRI